MDDREVPAGEVGEPLARGPYTIRGYYRADAHNRTAFTAGGFDRTGDRGRAAARRGQEIAMKKKVAKRTAARSSKDLTARKTRTVRGGEAQVFTSVSNVLKTRHDTVKNSIGNIR
jgi:non-ribosomal peptide synthetase component E (peptide arylation enzyme)